MSEWKNMSLGEFQEKLASKDPTPGGGSAAAVALGQAAALTEMVSKLTLGREKWEQGWGAAEKTKLVTTNIISGSAFELAQKDSEAFESVMSAYKLPRDSEDDKKHRRMKIVDATWSATLVPLETAEIAHELLSTLPDLAKWGNSNAVTDVGVASLLASAACKGALFNVEINLESLPEDDVKVIAIKDKIEKIRLSASELSKECMKSVKERI